VAIIPSPSVNRLSYFLQFLYILSLERGESAGPARGSPFFFRLIGSSSLLDLTDLSSLFSYLSISLLFFIFTTWRGETFVVVVRCQPLLQQFLFFLHFVGGLKEFETKRENQRPTVWPFEFVSLFYSFVFSVSLCAHKER
jgi:hypothetical protein